MKFKKIAIGLTVLTAMNTTTPIIKVFANELETNKLKVERSQNHTSVMKKFDLENHKDFEKYKESFKISKNLIKNVSSNGGNHSTSVPENVLDENPSTKWETGKANSATFTNEFNIEFNELVNIDKLTYKVRQDVRTKGFLNEYEIYGSKSESGDDFTLLTKGTGNKTRETMEIRFDEAQVKRVKIVFVNADENWASMSELAFYKKDIAMDVMGSLFTDETKTQVSEEYKDINKLNELEKIAKEHPFYENEYKDDIADAKFLVNNGDTDIVYTDAQMSIFRYLNNEAYQNEFKVSNDNIEHIKNNAGNWSDKVITNAIDGDINTHWETNKGNSSTWNNEVEVEFKERETLNRIAYGARQADSKGFAEEFDVYVSNTSSGDNYELLTTGKYNKTKDIVEARFEPTQVKRVKFKFKKSISNWATLSEIGFYKEDKVFDEVNSVFEDNLHTVLSSNYDTVSEITELEKKVVNHPLENELMKVINLAKKIINGNDIEKSEIITLSQRGNENVVRNEKRQVFSGGNLDLTGYYVMPGESIEVFVDANKDDVLPDLVFAQVGEVDNGDKGNKVKDLSVGRNVVTAPEGTKGFAIYFANQALPNEQEYAPKVRIQGENLKKYPVYMHGKTDPNEYIENVKKHTGANMTDVAGERFLISAQNSEAKIAYIDNKKSPLDTAIEMENMINQFDEISGLDPNHENPAHRPSMSLYHLKLTDGGGLFAANSFTHLGAASARTILSGDGVYWWGNLHEFGHQRESKDMGIGEVTNNMYSMTIQLREGLPKVTEDTYNNVQKIIDEYFVTQKGGFEDGNEHEFTYGTKLMAVYQIINYFGIETYSEAYKILRENPGKYNREDREQTFICMMSMVTGYDLAPHFEYYKQPVSDETKAYTSQFKTLDKKIKYTMLSAQEMIRNNVETFNGETKAIIEDIKTEADGFTLKLKTNDDNKGTIAYEIFRDGKFVGISRDGKFKDVVDTNKSYNYEVVAYDYRVNESIKSEVVNSQIGFKPVIEVEENVVVKLNDKFNPLQYITPKAYDGEILDISSVKVIKNNVDISKKGMYSVTYEVQDKKQTVTKDMDVEVVSNYNYVSDTNWVSATTGWGSVTKDASSTSGKGKIKLNVDGEIKEFEKGISAVANSEIIYNLEDKDYSHFTAYVGTDKNYNNNATSMIFKVIADGKEIYSSDLVKADSKAEFIKIPVSGVKELKLVMNDNNDGITADFGSWADAKFITTNSKPQLEVEKSIVTEVGQNIDDLVGKVVATDIEDGDISSKVVVEAPKDINFNKPGTYKVKYSVTDSDNNTITKERSISIIDERDNKFLSDYEWSSAVQSYKTPQKDSNMNGGTLKLTNNDGNEVTYEKGIGAHAKSEIVYDLSDKNAVYFTSFVGVDRVMYGRGSSVVFEVYVDGEKTYDSGLMTSKDPQKFVKVDISGAKELKIVVTDGGNGNGQDHATWGDTKLYSINTDRADLTKLQSAIEKAENIDRTDLTEESLANLDKVVNEAKELLNLDFVNQDKCDEAIANIENAIKNLESSNKEIKIKDKLLEEDIKSTLGIKDRAITIKDMQNLTSLTSDSGYVRSLDGLQYAKNLETLNVDYNEITDISLIGKLEKLNNFSAKENYRDIKNNVVHENGKFILEQIVIDADGKKILPKEVVVSPYKDPVKLNLSEVLVGDKIVIDENLIKGSELVNIIYESKTQDYQLHASTMLNSSNSGSVEKDNYDPTKIYLEGDVVIYKGETYTAKWWVQGEEPDKSNAWEKEIKQNEDGSVNWTEGMVCNQGDVVVYNGKKYEAKWWTTSTPGSDDSWKLLY